jgi:hypothetical protein
MDAPDDYSNAVFLANHIPSLAPSIIHHSFRLPAIYTADTVFVEVINLTSLKIAAGIPLLIRPRFIHFTA